MAWSVLWLKSPGVGAQIRWFPSALERSGSPLEGVGAYAGPLLMVAGILVRRASRPGEILGMVLGALGLVAFAQGLACPADAGGPWLIGCAAGVIGSASLFALAFTCRFHPVTARVGRWAGNRFGIVLSLVVFGLVLAFVGGSSLADTPQALGVHKERTIVGRPTR
jgi:hypothetical protein